MTKDQRPQEEARHDSRKQMSREVFNKASTDINKQSSTKEGGTDKRENNHRAKNTNLTRFEQKGLRSLQKRVANGEIMIATTDKSAKFAILTPAQYVRSGLKHVSNDTDISFHDVESIQT